MQDVGPHAPPGAGWWCRLDDGSIRRVWAYRLDGRYVCLRELSTPAQEAARLRLTTNPPDGSLRGQRDQAIVAGIRSDVLRTPALFEAYAFLGADAGARSALLEADPALTDADFSD